MIHEIEFAFSTLALMVIAVEPAKRLWFSLWHKTPWHEGAREWRKQQGGQQ